MKREELDLVVGDVIELAGGPRLVRRTSRQTPSADWTLSSMKMHLQSASAGHCCTVTAGGGTERGRVISAAHLLTPLETNGDALQPPCKSRPKGT